MTTPTVPLASGPSYSISIKCLATAAMAALLAGFWLAWPQMAHRGVSAEGGVFLALAGITVLAGYLSVLLGRTSISATELSRGWLWRTTVPLQAIAQVKFLRWRRLDWLVAPRLVVRAKGHGVQTFPAADPQVVRLMEAFVRG